MARPRGDLAGLKFGVWTVIAPSGNRHGQTVWLIQCQCGARRRMAGSDIRRALRSGARCRCSQCQAHRREPETLSFDYASQTGLMQQEFICGRRFRPA